METVETSAFIARTVESPVPKSGSETLEDGPNRGQESKAAAGTPSNEADTEKGTSSAITGGETLEMEEEKNSSQIKCCFGKRLWEKMTPKGGWRKKACTIVIVAVLTVANLIVCSLPTILYLITPVSVYFIHLYNIHVLPQNLLNQRCHKSRSYIGCLYALVKETKNMSNVISLGRA